MKRLLACALLILVPFASIRMVCFEAHDPAAAGSAPDPVTAAAAHEPESECERICMRRPTTTRPAANVTCVLVADPACSFLDTAAIAIMPPAPAMADSPAVQPFAASATDEYHPPLLPRHSPPPKA